MKCNALIKVETRTRKGSGKEYEKVLLALTPKQAEWFFHDDQRRLFLPKQFRDVNPETLVVCGGKIDANVRAISDPDWGGAAELEVNYKCLRCKIKLFEELDLPTDYNLSEWLTEQIALEP